MQTAIISPRKHSYEDEAAVCIWYDMLGYTRYVTVHGLVSSRPYDSPPLRLFVQILV